jgi:hypothetical protein
MNVFPTVHLAVYLYVFPTVFLAVFFVHIHTATVPSLLLRIRQRRRAVFAPSPRGRFFKFVARQRKPGDATSAWAAFYITLIRINSV